MLSTTDTEPPERCFALGLMLGIYGSALNYGYVYTCVYSALRGWLLLPLLASAHILAGVILICIGIHNKT